MHRPSDQSSKPPNLVINGRIWKTMEVCFTVGQWTGEASVSPVTALSRGTAGRVFLVLTSIAE